jgi:hypothetical protein
VEADVRTKTAAAGRSHRVGWCRLELRSAGPEAGSMALHRQDQNRRKLRLLGAQGRGVGRRVQKIYIHWGPHNR